MPRVLYVGELGPGSTAKDRAEALQSLGAEVDAIGPEPRRGRLGRIDWLISSRLQISPSIQRLNAAIAERLAARRYDILWLDKAWMVQPATVRAARPKLGSIILFNNDNPWGEHERGLWRLHKRLIPLVDEVMVPKYSVIRCYQKAGARRVSVVDFGFGPASHFAPDTPLDQPHELCFIGTALRDGGGIRPHRTAWMRELGRRLPGRISVFGYGWRKALRGAEGDFRIIADGVWGALYRETIWRSKLSLSFITRDNWEESSHRAFEITACGGCLLAERSSRLEQSFVEGEEAVYFDNPQQCAEQALALLQDDAARERIAAAGHRRALGSGYDNASRLAEAITRSPVLRPHFAAASDGADRHPGPGRRAARLAQ